MKRLFGASFLALALGSTAAAAWEIAPGLTLTGEVELEYADGENPEAILTGDATLSWRSGDAGGFALGVDLTVENSTILADSEHFTSYWGGLVLGTGFGELTVGVAEPVTQTVYSFPQFGTLSLFNISVPPFGSSYIKFFGLIADEIVLGAAFEGGTGPLRYGASIHEVDSILGTAQSIQVAATYQMGSTLLLGSVENVSADESVTVYRLGALHNIDAVTVGGEVAVVGGSALPDLNFVRLYGAYDVTTSLSLQGELGRSQEPGDTDMIWSLGAEYRLNNGAFVQGGVSSLGEDEVLDVGVGFRF